MSRTRQILIVEDEPNVRLTFRMGLESKEWKVATADDGESALKWLDREHADLILLDLRMPGMGGMELLRRLRVSGHDDPVVVITAQGSVANAVEAMREGAVDFLSKPLTPTALRQVVAEVLARQEMDASGAAHADHGERKFDMLSVAKRALNHRLFYRAEELLREAIHQHPDEAEPWYLLGVLREVQNKPRAASEAYRSAFGIDPNYLPAKLHLMKFDGHR